MATGTAMGTGTSDGDEALGFEALVREIDRVTAQLDKGELSLEDALKAFERGMALSRRASALLDAADGRLVRLMEGERGEVREAPLDLEGGRAQERPHGDEG